VLSVFQELTGVFGPSSLADLPPDVIWIDLLNPTTREIAIVESQKEVRIPSIEALSEIESSSRLAVDHDIIYLSVPAVAQGDTPDAHLSPTVFILTKSALITVRFAPLSTFDATAEKVRQEKRFKARQRSLRRCWKQW
jgi:magnesium transporter